MSKQQNTPWFIEYFKSSGTAFGLSIKEKLYDEQSDFQHIEVFETQTFGRLMALDGCIMLSERDHFIYHEVLAHAGLLNHRNPERVAIIGGGDCGTLFEVLKHDSVKSVIQVELDEKVTKTAERYFPQLCAANADARVEFVFGDGHAWMQTVAPGSIDLIIVDSTDPIGPAAVLFSQSFLGFCYQALAEGGVLIQQSESPILHTQSVIKPLYSNLYQCGFGYLQTFQFPQPVYPSGWWSATLAIKGCVLNAEQQQARLSLLSSLSLRYLNAQTYQACQALPAFMEAELRIDKIR